MALHRGPVGRVKESCYYYYYFAFCAPFVCLGVTHFGEFLAVMFGGVIWGKLGCSEGPPGFLGDFYTMRWPVMVVSRASNMRKL